MSWRLVLCSLLVLPATERSAAAQGRILHATEMTATDFAALDRRHTVVLLPGGILEEHGLFLPSYSDGFLNERLTDTLARAIAQRPGWTAVIFPPVPLGNSGANDVGARYSFPGTFTVRFETLRAIYLDLADELGAQGFRWVFVLHLHGAPNHNRALDEAGDYFHATFGGRMVHLGGLMSVFAAIAGPKADSAARADGLPIHAGMDETSWMLHLRPDLVRPEYRAAPDEADSLMEGLVRRAARPGWPGYFGAPRLATPGHGAAIWRAVADSAIRVARRVLDGTDPSRMERYATVMAASPVDVRLDAASRAAEAARARRQQDWIRRNQGR